MTAKELQRNRLRRLLFLGLNEHALIEYGQPEVILRAFPSLVHVYRYNKNGYSMAPVGWNEGL